jgi:hypothetical protein
MIDGGKMTPNTFLLPFSSLCLLDSPNLIKVFYELSCIIVPVKRMAMQLKKIVRKFA